MRSPTPKYSYHKWRNDHGGALVEFAIVMPLLLLIVGGIIEFGLLYYNKQVITNASREGARAATSYRTNNNGDRIKYDATEIADIVESYCKYINDNGDTKYKLISFGGTRLPTTAVTDPATIDYPEDLTVVVTFEHHFLFSSFLNLFGADFGPTLEISATTVMRME